MTDSHGNIAIFRLFPLPAMSNSWTPARFRSFIMSGLRQVSNRWPPKYEVKKQARVERGIYLCAGYKKKPHKGSASLPPAPGNKRRINNAQVDHKNPIIDPVKGFQSWDAVIARLFCEESELQVLCHECHSRKTADERVIRKGNKK